MVPIVDIGHACPPAGTLGMFDEYKSGASDTGQISFAVSIHSPSRHGTWLHLTCRWLLSEHFTTHAGNLARAFHVSTSKQGNLTDNLL